MFQSTLISFVHLINCIAVSDTNLVFCRFGPKIKSMTLEKVKRFLRIYDRIQAVPRADRLILDLDERYSTHHCFATAMGLELLCNKTALPKNPAQQDLLLGWVLDIVIQDIYNGSMEPDASKQPLTMSIQKALLKRRILFYCMKKFKGPAKEEGYTPGRSPDVVLVNVFQSYKAFVESGLQDPGSSGNLAWLGKLPTYQIECCNFLSKLIKGHRATDDLLEESLVKDPTVQAEQLFASDTWKKSKVFDFDGVLELKTQAVQESQEAAKAAEAAAAAAAAAQSMPATEPAQDLADEAMPAAVVEEQEADPPAEPAKLDRSSFWPRLHLPELVKDILHRNADDDWFQQVVDFARLRACLS